MARHGMLCITRMAPRLPLALLACLLLARACAAGDAATPTELLSIHMRGGASADPAATLLLKGASLCKHGPSPVCCNLINSALGHPENPVSKCMCVAKVMAGIERAGFGLAGVVESCAAAQRDVGAATAFLQRQADTCPAGAVEGSRSMSERAANVARVKPLLAAAVDADAPKWAAANIQQGLLGGAGADAVGAVVRSLSYRALMWVPIAGAAVFVLSLAVHFAVMNGPVNFRRRIEALGLEQRLVTYQHMMFVVLFAAQIIPYTIWFFRFFFMKWSAEYFVGSDRFICELGVIVGAMIMSHAYIYCMEGGLRCVVKPNSMLMVHHALFFILLICGIWLGPSALMLKATLVLDVGAVHELPLYVGLLVYRLSSRPRLVRGCLVVGVTWYAITRVVQTALLIWLLAVSDRSLQRSAPYIISVIVCSTLTGVQAYTFRIYAGMYRRIGRRAIEAVSDSESDLLSPRVAIAEKAEAGIKGSHLCKACQAGSPCCACDSCCTGVDTASQP